MGGGARTARAPAREVVVCGVRHHGPGSARSVLAVLDAVRPSTVVIEGPPELTGIAAWAADPGLVPPVAALAYRPDAPRRAAFYPMASSSPEWVALRWALDRDAQVAFADLPAANALADEAEAPDRRDRPDPADAADGDLHRPLDPIGLLAAAAGYDDAERWWEDAVEHRRTAEEGFAAIAEAIAAMRQDHRDDRLTLQREAAMRKVLRAAVRSGEGPVVVVCGAYHAPVLDPAAWPSQAADAAVLSGLRRRAVRATWVPWTAARLARSSGYGAGVTAPGWYAHCFATDEATRTGSWMVAVARALRDADLPAPTASAVEATRLADALAALRGRPHPGLAECTDAALAVLCAGRPEPLRVVHDAVVVGHAVGEVPPDVPQVPLARDLEAQARSARLRRTAEAAAVTCDLRTPAGLAKSVLLHRLALLGIPWGRPVDPGGTLGTFREVWELRWQPELSVAVIEAAAHGSTVEAAAADRVLAMARDADRLLDVVRLLQRCQPALLPEAADRLVAEVDRRAARSHDVLALMAASEPLATTCRYGDVRGSDTTGLRVLLDRLIRRVAAGLAPALSGLDDDAAVVARTGVDAVADATRLLDHPDLTTTWLDAVARVADLPGTHPGITGRVVRLLLDHGRMPTAEAAARLGRALSPGRPAPAAAAWVDGFLEGDAVLLLLDPVLLDLLDGWVAGAPPAIVDDLVPLLRRTFGRFTAAERAQIGQRLRHGRRPGAATLPWDPARADAAAHHVLDLLGGPRG